MKVKSKMQTDADNNLYQLVNFIECAKYYLEVFLSETTTARFLSRGAVLSILWTSSQLIPLISVSDRQIISCLQI